MVAPPGVKVVDPVAGAASAVVAVAVAAPSSVFAVAVAAGGTAPVIPDALHWWHGLCVRVCGRLVV